MKTKKINTRKELFHEFRKMFEHAVNSENFITFFGTLEAMKLASHEFLKGEKCI